MNPMHIRQLAQQHADEFIAIRRDLHQHPELAFNEHRTSARVAELLHAWGYQVERGMGGTGVVGQLVRGQGSKRLGLRADMDALPIQEPEGLVPYRSRTDGVMHACGHDGHSAMLLLGARLLAEHGSFDGTLNLIFQPAEEVGVADCGARRMMADGLFDKYPCDAIFGMHNLPGHAQGSLLLRAGPTMASSDRVFIVLEGRGGHGAMPQHADDPVVAAASLVMALQTIVSRNVDPQQTAVLTIGRLQTGRTYNVIPQTAELELSIRTHSEAVRMLMRRRILELTEYHAKSFGCTAKVDYREGYAVLVNDPQQTEFAHRTALALLGEQNVMAPGPVLNASEDFAFMLQQVPGSYVYIGNGQGNEAGACMVHNPNYIFNDDNIAVGGAFWALLAQRFLNG